MATRPKRKAAAKGVLKRRAQDSDFSDSGGNEDASMEYRSEEDVSDDNNGNDVLEEKPEPSLSRAVKRQKKVHQPLNAEAEPSAPFQTLPMGKSKQQGKLSLLPSMPLDILFAVFSFLQPKDILNLSRTTRTFRDVLMTRQATTVWKTARERIGAPDCPAIISEPHWASLLLGRVCQSCGAKHVQYAFFTLLRRTCKSCKSQHLVLSTKVKKLYPKIDPTVLELIPYLGRGRKNNLSYWDGDIEKMNAKFATFKDNIKKRVPGAQSTFDDFKTQRKSAIAALPQVQQEWRQFLCTFNTERYQEERGLGERRLQLIKERFKALGYEDEDLHCLSWNSVCNRQAELTNRAWQLLRKEVEVQIIHNKERRLEAAQASTCRPRRRLIKERYDEYRRQLSPAKWKYLPRALDISYFQPFAELVTADSKTPITAKSFDEAFKQLPQLLEDYDTRLKERLRDLLPGAKKGKGKARASSSTAPDPLDLAQSVFECRRRGYRCSHLVGWDDIASHHCLEEISGLHNTPDSHSYDRCLSYSAHGAAFADRVIELAGLNLTTASAEEMDQLDLRFACSCNKFTMIPGYRWRDLIHHLVENEKSWTHRGSPQIYTLSGSQTAVIKKKERMCSDSVPNWICGHCPEYDLSNRGGKTAVELHVQERHAIKAPAEGTDVLYFTRVAPSFYPRPSVAAQSPSDDQSSTPTITITREEADELFQCLRCADAVARSTRRKTFTLDAVTAHLLAKHQVPSAKMGTDYRNKPAED